MLTITIPKVELFDDNLQEFVKSEAYTLDLEHSLVSLSKWESKWEKPFLGVKPHNDAETLDYIRCMVIDEEADLTNLKYVGGDTLTEINEYIQKKMTATWLNDQKNPKRSNEAVTAELIYYWMIQLTIPFECQYWHLNRLMTLITVCNVKNAPEKKMSRSEIAARQHALNEKRRKELKTSG